MTRVINLAPGPTELDQVWGLRDGYYKLFMEDYNKSISRGDPVLVELCRLRIAQLVESRFDLALRYSPAVRAGLSDDKIAALPRYPTSEVFTERERICLEFTEQFVISSSAISDEDVARVMTVLTPEEFIHLCKALSVMDQFARASSAFRLAPPPVVPPTMPDFLLPAQADA